MAELTYREMLAKAKEAFGEQVSLDYDEYSGWIIRTDIAEEVDMSEFKGTPAMAAYDVPEYNYGSDLERWAYKNGQHGSLYQAALAYNAKMIANARAGVELVRKMIAEGRAFDWEGGIEYRDAMLALGEERGW